MQYMKKLKVRVDISQDRKQVQEIALYEDKSPIAKLRKIKNQMEREHNKKRGLKLQKIIEAFRKPDHLQRDKRHDKTEYTHDVEIFQHELQTLLNLEGSSKSKHSILEYIKLQDCEVQKIKNRQKLPSLNQLSPRQQRTEPNDNSVILTNIDQESLESPRRAIPEVEPYFFGRTMNNFLKKTYHKKRRIQDLILNLENQRVNLDESHRKQLISDDEQKKKKRLNSFNPTLQNEGIEYYVHNHKYDNSFNIDPMYSLIYSRSVKKEKPDFRSSAYSKFDLSQEQPMNIQRVKDKLIYDIIRQGNSEDGDAFDPLRLQFFSLSKLILQYQKTKNEKTQKLHDIITKSDTQRKESLTEKNRLYNTEYSSLTIENIKKVRSSLNRSLDSRMNLHQSQVNCLIQLMEQLKFSEISITEPAKRLLELIREILMNGKGVTQKDLSGFRKMDDNLVNQICQQILNPSRNK